MRKRLLTVVFLWGLPAFSQNIGGYGGPAILTRGVGTAGRRGTELMRVQAFAGVSGVYDTGITPVSLDDKGDVREIGGLYGVEANVGAYGAHSWRRSTLGLSYAGNYRHYSQNTFFNGSDHMLSLDLDRQLSRRWTVYWRTLAGTASRAFGVFAGPLGTGFLTPVDQAVPLNEIFDNRLYYAASYAGATATLSPRNSISFQGGGYVARRRSRALVGVNGYNFAADFARRVSRHTTLTAGYMFMHFAFPGAFGRSDIHGVSTGFGYSINRNWTLSVQAGGFRIRTLGLRRVELDPVVAELLGLTAGIEAFDGVNYAPMGGASLMRTFRRSSASLYYTRFVSPGNGVLLTSVNESAGAGYAYTGLRRWSLGADANYNRLRGLGLRPGAFEFYTAGGNAGYQILPNFNASVFLYYRRAIGDNTAFRRNGMRFMVTLGYNTGEYPISWR